MIPTVSRIASKGEGEIKMALGSITSKAAKHVAPPATNPKAKPE